MALDEALFDAAVDAEDLDIFCHPDEVREAGVEDPEQDLDDLFGDFPGSDEEVGEPTGEPDLPTGMSARGDPPSGDTRDRDPIHHHRGSFS